jgi:hypothetical protein
MLGDGMRLTIAFSPSTSVDMPFPSPIPGHRFRAAFAMRRYLRPAFARIED